MWCSLFKILRSPEGSNPSCVLSIDLYLCTGPYNTPFLNDSILSDSVCALAICCIVWPREFKIYGELPCELRR